MVAMAVAVAATVMALVSTMACAIVNAAVSSLEGASRAVANYKASL